MRKVVIASFLLASARIAASQPADQPAPPPPPPEGELTPPPKEEPAAPTPPPEEAAPMVPVVVAEPKKEKPTVSATYDGGLVLKSSDGLYELKVQFRNQMRFESLRPTEDNRQFLNKFYIPRSRLQVEGHVFGAENRYKLELSMDDSGSFSFVKDMYMERRVSDAPVYLRFGQWKRPFFRQEMVSDFSSEFNERSIANDLAGGGRDLGFSVNNDYEKSPEGIEWVVGMFNTMNGGADRPTIPVACVTAATPATPAGVTTTCVNGRATNFPLDFQPAIVARAGWNSPKSKGYSEVDLEGGPLRYSVAGAFKIDLANFAEHGKSSVFNNMSKAMEVDWNVKAYGLSFSGGAVIMFLKDADPEYGFVLQPGFMILPKHAEIAARFAFTTQLEQNNIEALGAFNYFFNGHRLKIASDFGIVETTGVNPVTLLSDSPDIRVRIMSQLEI